MEYCNNCHHCLNVIEAARVAATNNEQLPLGVARMVLCPTCGNKRCPHASDHRLGCTGSNEPGQPGSIYVKPLTDKEFAEKFGKSRSELTSDEWWAMLMGES